MQANEEFISLAELDKLLKSLQTVLEDDDLDDIKNSLTTIVTEYTPWKTISNQEVSTNKHLDNNIIQINR